MGIRDKAYTRVTLWLQTKGHLLDRTAPAKKGAIIRAIREQFADDYNSIVNSLEPEKRNTLDVVIAFCGLHQIDYKSLRRPDEFSDVNKLKPVKTSPKISSLLRKATSDSFLESFEWRKMRVIAIKKYGAQCQCCGAMPPHVVINVDHIKPRRLFPHLALDIDNLQILCHDCNHGKGNWDMTDWRPHDEKLDDEQSGHLRSILGQD